MNDDRGAWKRTPGLIKGKFDPLGLARGNDDQ